MFSRSDCTRRSVRSILVLALLASLITVLGPISRSAVAGAAPGGSSTKYVAFAPIRVLDTRTTGNGPLGALQTRTVQPLSPAVLSQAGVPAGQIGAVAVNVTMVEPEAPGWLKVYPFGEAAPSRFSASTVNNQLENEIIANLAIVPVGLGDRIAVQSLVGSHVVIDVQGVFVRSASSADGRFVPLDEPTRAVDTRKDGDEAIARFDERVFDLTTAGVPATASAAVINVVAADTREPGYLTVFPAGSLRPKDGSNINYPGGNYNAAGNVITGLTGGNISIYAHGTTDVIIDVIGYMTGADADVSTRGLFVPIAPERFYDSRPDEPPLGSTALQPRSTFDVQVAGVAGKSVPGTGVLAVSGNLTMTNTLGGGFLAAYPKVRPRGEYSSVNSVYANHSVANHAVVALSGSTFQIYSHEKSDVVVDISGYFLDGRAEPLVKPIPAGIIAEPQPDGEPVRPRVPPADDDYTYLFRASSNEARFAPYELDGRRYFGWDPCRPITYRTNVTRANQAQTDAMNVAILNVEAATGIDLQYIGEYTGSMNTDKPLDLGGAMALIGFSDENDIPDLVGGTIGLGGISGYAGPNLVRGSASNFYYFSKGGFAVADIDNVGNDTDKITSTFMHEIAHLIGSDHVTQPDEIMYGFINPFPLTAYNTGDLNGLYNLGEKNCLRGALHEAPDVDDIPPSLTYEFSAT